MKTLQTLRKLTNRIKEVYPDMTVRQFAVFLEVAYEPGETQFSYGKRLGEAEPQIHRTVKKLGMDDIGILTTGTRPDGRSKSVLVSQKGEKLLGDLYEIIA